MFRLRPTAPTLLCFCDGCLKRFKVGLCDLDHTIGFGRYSRTGGYNNASAMCPSNRVAVMHPTDKGEVLSALGTEFYHGTNNTMNISAKWHS